MFSCSPKLRATQVPNLNQRSISPFNITIHNLQSYFDTHSNIKIETNHLIPNQPMKSSSLQENNYNTMIYQWRKVERAPIVGVTEMKQNQGGKVSIKNTNLQINGQNVIIAESILFRINIQTGLSKEQMLFVFKSMLDGHQSIFKKMKATNVSLQKTVVNFQGEVKVWVNQCFESNDISGQVLSRQDLIVERIFQNICALSQLNQHRLQDFLEYVKTSMKRNGKWSFSYLRGLIRSYSDCMKLKIVNKIINELKSDQKTLKDSHVSNSSLNRNRSRHISIFQTLKKSNNFPHHIDSQAKWNEKNRQKSQKSQNSKDSQFSPKLGSFKSILKTETPTWKVIKEKQDIGNILKRSKHSNSISGFENILKDSIVEQGRPSLKAKWQTKKSLEKQHQTQTKSFHFIFNKIGIPQALDQSSQTTTPHHLKTPERSPRLAVELKRNKRLSIISQFGLTISKNVQKSEGKPKDSLISTTNQTNVSGFIRKFKQSHLTVCNDERQQLRTTSKDRYQRIQNPIENQKIIGSYTHSSNPSNLKDLGRLIKKVEQSKIIQTKQEQMEESLQFSAKLGISKQVISYKNIEEQQSESGNAKLLKAEKNSQNDFKDLKTLKFSQSYENLAEQTVGFKPPNHQIKHLLNINRNLTFSTYIDSNSQKVISHQSSSKKLKELQQTLQQLFQANEKQNQVFQVNNWTKKLDNLFEIKVKEEMKESINFGNQELCEERYVNRSKWDKLGREIGESMIPK